MLGTVINSIAIIAGCLVGLLAKGKIPERIGDTIMKGLALCVLYIGISGALKEENIIIMIISIAIGGLVGEIVDIDRWLNKLGAYLESKFKKNDHKVSIAEGFVSSSLLFCVGAMAVVGSLESGMQGVHTTLFAKSALDGISSIIFTSTLGIGVIFSAATVFLYQGIITIGAGWLSVILNTEVISLMSGVGSLLIIGLGINMLGITKIKVANLLPAIFVAMLIGIFI